MAMHSEPACDSSRSSSRTILVRKRHQPNKKTQHLPPSRHRVGLPGGWSAPGGAARPPPCLPHSDCSLEPPGV